MPSSRFGTAIATWFSMIRPRSACASMPAPRAKSPIRIPHARKIAFRTMRWILPVSPSSPSECVQYAEERRLRRVLLVEQQRVIRPELRGDPRVRVGEAPEGHGMAARLGDAHAHNRSIDG